MIYFSHLAIFASLASACTDFAMNFTNPSIVLSVRTMDLGSTTNWTMTSWPAQTEYSSDHGDESYHWTANYNSVGITGNWFGDDHYGFPSLFGDGINDQGLSCAQLTLVGTKYESPNPLKKNIFYGTFCQWAIQTFANVQEVHDALPGITIYGPEILEEHFVLRDASGTGLVIELLNGKKHYYLDYNDKISGVGIMTNEPPFDFHLTNIAHYEWKRDLARQAVPVPGSWYPEERFLRAHMVKSGMQSAGHFNTDDFQFAVSLSAQVLNTVTVPMGEQYGTDTGEKSGEGSAADHTIWGAIRDHKDPAIYWRDATNPSLRLVRLRDIDWSAGRRSLIMETGPFVSDMTSSMH